MGAENIKGDNIDLMNKFLIEHIKTLKSKSFLKSALVVFVPESNLDVSAQLISNFVKSKIQPLCIMNEDGGKPGIRTTNNLKHAMALKLRKKIELGYLFFHNDLVTLHSEKNKEEMMEEFVSQLTHYSRIVKKAKNKTDRPTITFSGKGGAGFDDLCMALQINLIMKKTFFENTSYKSYN